MTIEKVPCKECQVLILPATAASNDGLRRPCKRGTRRQLEAAKEERVRIAEQKKESQRRYDVLFQELSKPSDAQIIAKLESVPALADEDDPAWSNEEYWRDTAEVYFRRLGQAKRRPNKPIDWCWVCAPLDPTYGLPLSIAPGALPPLAGDHPLGSALYFLVTPHAPVRLHRIRNDQLYHYYLGDPIEVILLHDDGTHERAVVGPDLRAGERVQLLIPGGTFHTARLAGRRRWFLGASTEWPGVVPADVEPGDLDALAARHKDIARELRSIMGSVAPAATTPGMPR